MYALVDCNNFYVSCERVFDPKLNDRPVIVLSNNDGCVISRSNEAKELGIRMGAPFFEMEPLLRQHNVAVFSSNYQLYGDMSDRVMQTLAHLVANVEVYSIDEAFLDLSDYLFARPDLDTFVREIRATVYQWTGIPISIGIAPTKTLAKMANRLVKKDKRADGVCWLRTPEQIRAALDLFPVENLWGVGRQYNRLMQENDIKTAADLARMQDAWIRKQMTVDGLRMVLELRGYPCRRLDHVLGDPGEIKKAMCCSRSFGHLSNDYNLLSEAVATFVGRVAHKLRRQHSAANLLTIFIHTNKHRIDLPQQHSYRTVTLPVATNHTPDLLAPALQILKEIWQPNYLYMKAGALVSGLVPENVCQANLFAPAPDPRQTKLMSVMDSLNTAMGRETVRLAAEGPSVKSGKAKWEGRHEHLSPRYTTEWKQLLRVSAEDQLPGRTE